MKNCPCNNQQTSFLRSAHLPTTHVNHNNTSIYTHSYTHTHIHSGNTQWKVLHKSSRLHSYVHIYNIYIYTYAVLELPIRDALRFQVAFRACLTLKPSIGFLVIFLVINVV